MLIPDDLKGFIRGAVWERDTIGCSSSAVYRLKGVPNVGNAYLKVQRATGADGLKREREVLDWLRGRLPAPQTLCFSERDEMQYLLITEIPGSNCADGARERDPKEVAMLVANGLRMIHATDISECPFDRRLDAALNEALQRVGAGLVDETDLEAENLGRTASEIYEELTRTKPFGEDLVFAHGDYCLPNIIISDGKISGFVDWGRAGVADRYQDLALVARSLRHNMGSRGDELASLFFDEYGVENVDTAKVYYYTLLDELY